MKLSMLLLIFGQLSSPLVYSFVHVARFSSPTTAPRLLPVSDIIIAMSTCHSLTIIDDELSGYPIDIKMFESIVWVEYAIYVVLMDKHAYSYIFKLSHSLS